MWIVLSLPVHTAGLPGELSTEQELGQVPASSLSLAAPLSVVYILGFSHTASRMAGPSEDLRP